MFKKLICLALMLPLVACATVTVTPEDVQSVNAGDMAIIVMTAGFGENTSEKIDGAIKSFLFSPGNPTCIPDTVWVSHLEGNMSYPLRARGLGKYSVPPGKYRLQKGSCTGPNETGNMPLLGLWFMPIEVKAGEIVNIGQIQMNVNTQKSAPTSDMSKALNFIVTGDSSKIVQYATYVMEPGDTEKIKRKLKKSHPDMNGKFVTRVPERFFDEAEFINAVNQAHKRDENGKPVSPSLARERLTENLRALIKARLEEIKLKE